MVNQHDLMENMRNLQVPDDVRDLVNGIVSGIIALAVRAANSNSDSNSLGGILDQPVSSHQAPDISETCPRSSVSTRGLRLQKLSSIISSLHIRQ
jgi:hypothetical protein